MPGGCSTAIATGSCTFNDDIQGTAAVAAGTLLAAVKVTGVPLREQRIAIVGAGSAGCGIAALLMRAMVDAGLAESEARTPLLRRRPRRAAGRGHARPPRFPGAVRADSRRGGRLEARAAGPDRSARRGAERQAHRADRRVGARRHVQRGRRARHGGRRSSGPIIFPAVQSHLLRRGRATGPDELDRGRAP